jgi:hypothetical protein
MLYERSQTIAVFSFQEEVRSTLDEFDLIDDRGSDLRFVKGLECSGDFGIAFVEGGENVGVEQMHS